MPISSNYLLLQSQIADELGGRTDLLSVLSGSGLTLSPIKNAIQSAVAKWERVPFYFNESYDTSFFTTVNNQELYTSATSVKISTLVNIYRLHVTISGVRYPLKRRAWQYIEDNATSTTAGSPTDFAYFAQQIRMYPIPDGAYVVAAAFTQRVPLMTADGDSTIWTSDGFDLIRCEAKRILAMEVLHDAEMAQRMRIAIHGDPGDPRDTGYLGILKEETARRGRFDWVQAEREDPTGAVAVARSA